MTPEAQRMQNVYIYFIALHCTFIIILFVNVTCLLRYHYQIKYLICIACSCAEMDWQYECTVFCQANKANQIEKKWGEKKRTRQNRQEIERVRQNTTKRNPQAVCLCGETDTIQVEISFLRQKAPGL